MRFIHHLPWERIDRPAFAERRIEEYEADSPAIYIAGMDEVGQMLADHPEIGFVVSIYDRNINDILDAIDTHRPNGDVRYGHFPITDWDIRAAGSEDAIRPNRENVGELLTFLRQWHDAATSGTDAPSLLVHCAQGMYRSGAAALTAHVLHTGDPLESAVELLFAGDQIDCNHEIARMMDEHLALDGSLATVGANIEAAYRKVYDWRTRDDNPSVIPADMSPNERQSLQAILLRSYDERNVFARELDVYPWYEHRLHGPVLAGRDETAALVDRAFEKARADGATQFRVAAGLGWQTVFAKLRNAAPAGRVVVDVDADMEFPKGDPAKRHPTPDRAVRRPEDEGRRPWKERSSLRQFVDETLGNPVLPQWDNDHIRRARAGDSLVVSERVDHPEVLLLCHYRPILADCAVFRMLRDHGIYGLPTVVLGGVDDPSWCADHGELLAMRPLTDEESRLSTQKVLEACHAVGSSAAFDRIAEAIATFAKGNPEWLAQAHKTLAGALRSCEFSAADVDIESVIDGARRIEEKRHYHY